MKYHCLIKKCYYLLIRKNGLIFGIVVSVFLVWGSDNTQAQKSTNKPDETLRKIRNRCYSIIEEAMSSEEAFIRSGAVRAAGESKDEKLIPLLKKGSRDFYPTTRQFSLQGLKNISTEEARVVALDRLEDTNIWVKSTALDILADLGLPQDIPKIKLSLNTPDRMVRLATHYALYKLGDKKNFDELVDSLDSGDLINKYQAIFYLGKIGNENSLSHLGVLLQGQDSEVLTRSLKAIGEKIDMGFFRNLIRLSQHSDPKVRREVILELGYLPKTATKKHIEAFCDDPDPLVSLTAAVSLNRQGENVCEKNFDSLIRHPDFGVRSSTARILGSTPISQRSKILATALSDSTTRVRTAAVRAVGMMGGVEAFSLLLQMLDDPQLVIRTYAAGNLLRVMGQ